MVLLGSDFTEVSKGDMKKSYCVYVGRVHIYYLIKPCFVLLCFELANQACHLFFGYNWGRDLILRPGWQEKRPCELCRTRLQMNDDIRKNLKHGSPIYRFIHLRLNVRAVSWQWPTPGGQHKHECGCGTPGSREKITPSINPHEAWQIEMRFPEIHLSERQPRKLSRVY